MDPKFNMPDKAKNRPKTTSSWLFEELRADIIAGRYPAGKAIRQEEIATRFEVSRMPVREVFRLLEAEGLVELRPHRGVVVTELDEDEALEIFETRVALEILAVRRSFPRLTDEQVKAIETAHETLRNAVPKHSADLHRDFHVSLYAGAGPRLRRLVSEQLDAAQRYHLRFGRLAMEVTQQDRDDHVSLAAAAVKRNTREAVKILRAHLSRGAAEITKSIESHKKKTAKSAVEQG